MTESSTGCGPCTTLTTPTARQEYTALCTVAWSCAMGKAGHLVGKKTYSAEEGHQR
jgi:hypothetical protein